VIVNAIENLRDVRHAEKKRNVYIVFSAMNLLNPNILICIKKALVLKKRSDLFCQLIKSHQ